MAPDFLVHFISSFFGIVFLVAILAIPTFFVRIIFRRSFDNFGFKKIVFGYFLVVVAMLILSIGVAGVAGVAGGGKVGYFFVLLIIFALPFSTLLIMPVALLLAARGLGTVVMLAGVGLISGLALTALGGVFPKNDWARTHHLEASLSIISSFGFFTVLVSCAFAIGAQMPFWRFKISSN